MREFVVYFKDQVDAGPIILAVSARRAWAQAVALFGDAVLHIEETANYTE